MSNGTTRCVYIFVDLARCCIQFCAVNPQPRPSGLRRNLAAEVAEALREEIVSGILSPGAALSEPALAKHFGLSRVPVREALIELEREGLLQFESTGRTRVRTMNEVDLDEIIEARVILESAAARRVSEIWSAADTEWVQANIDAQKDATTLSELSRLDVELHLYVMKRAGNGRLLRMWQIVRWQFQMCVSMAHRLQETLAFKPHQITVEAHARLLKALASRNPALAASTMAAHIENAKEWTHGNTGFGGKAVSPVVSFS